MTRTPWYLSLLFSLVFVAAPAMVIYWFFLPGWGGNGYPDGNYWLYWVIAISFIVYVISISALFIFLNIVKIDCLNIDLPMAIGLMVILVACPAIVPWWSKLLMMVGVMLLAFPINMLTTRILEKQDRARIEKNKILKG